MSLLCLVLSRERRRGRSLLLTVISNDLVVCKILQTITLRHLACFIFELDHLEGLASLCLEKLKKDFRWMMRKSFESYVTVIEWLQYIIKQGFCACWREVVGDVKGANDGLHYVGKCLNQV